MASVVPEDLITEYKKARKAAQNRYHRLKKQGFKFEKSPIPAIPSTISQASIEELKALTSDKLKEKIPTIVDTVLRTTINELERWEPEPHWSDWLTNYKRNNIVNPMLNILNGAIEDLGREAVARNLEASAEEFITCRDKLLYGSGSKGNPVVEDDRSELVSYATIIRGRALTPNESMDVSDYMDSL